MAALAVFTDSGRASRLLSKQRPQVPILAFTPEIETYRRLNLHWGVTPHFVPRVETIEEMLRVVEEAMLSQGSIQPGQQVVLICGYPIRENRPTNLAMLHTVGER